ncbi:TIGR02302 family protein [Vannielia litorea]|uniref:TIGR02302 family protein n=1 Tax=Vannielia litorea TaxID=1217970 RepID=A0A1N6DV68_9RHOB|nr:TIGR02302 family protein [Vannielia litorea]SIN74594.1 TIGR02302 family protein [Vannielia litorea]
MDPNAARSRALKRLMRPLQLTRMGMIAERVVRSFWPVWTLVFALAAALAFGAHDALPPEGVWAVGGLWIVAFIVALGLGFRAYHRPSGKEVVARLDATLPGRPIKALSDKQAIGAGDFGSEAVWNAHVERMAARIESARAVRPDLRLSDRDPYALRYAALGALVTALLFGSLWRITSLDDAAGAGAGAALAAGPSWEGWIEPPAYTGKPSLYLNDIAQAEFTVPEGSEVTIRLYGEVGALSVRETVSGLVPAAPAEEAAPAPADDGVRSFAVNGSGEIEIDGSGGRQWTVLISPDTVPRVELVGEIDKTAMGELQQRFRAEDDYGVVAGSARITLDEGALNRRYGLVAEPEPREPVVLDLPMTISGDRAAFEETLIDDLSKHAWANLPVVMQMTVEDANGQQGRSEARAMVLPGRRFFDPAAAALIELRRDLLWSRENAARTAQVLRTITWKPASALAQPRNYLQVRMVLKRLEAEGAELPEATRDELVEALWEIAVRIEEGTLSNALERLRQAQERLNEAIRNGASDEEIAQLMDELREAMQEYMRQLAQQQDPNQQQQGEQGESIELSQQDLQDMLDKLEELMQQGRTAEAQELLNQLMEMMQNMQVTQGQGGQGQQSPGEQAMEGLAETLRDQQGLSDEAFRDLQEQFNPNAQQGESGQNQGRNGNQGRGESHEQGQNQQGQGDNPDGRPGEGSQPDERSLAQRQNELRRELERQRGQLPGAGTEQGDAARRSLEDAGRAMDRAEESLRQGDLADAIDNQSQAIERLREGMRNLGEAMAEERRQQQGGQGENVGRADPNGRRDPLGRDRGSTGPLGTEEHMLQGDDVYRRARDLLDEIRRRSSDQGRPDVELEYLKRLLERF